MGVVGLLTLGESNIEEGAIKSSIENSRALGLAGEEAVGITGKKTAIEVAGRTRIPDALDYELGVLTEVKNVKYQGLTSQIRDFVSFSQTNNLNMILYTRESTVISKPLQQLIDNGIIIHKFIP